MSKTLRHSAYDTNSLFHSFKFKLYIKRGLFKVLDNKYQHVLKCYTRIVFLGRQTLGSWITNPCYDKNKTYQRTARSLVITEGSMYTHVRTTQYE